MEDLFLKIRRQETPFFRFLYNLAHLMTRINMPNCFLPFYSLLYYVRQGAIGFFRRTATIFYYGPMFRSKCKKAGKNLNYVKLRQGLPYFYGNIQIFLGDDVTVHSRSGFSAAKIYDTPTFRVGNRTYLGPGLSIGVAKEISIGSCCHVSSNVSIFDSDGHPHDFEKRSRGEPVEQKDITSVKIGDNVWIGEGAMILKGVTIGDGAIIGAKSVVTREVQPFAIVTGNPAVTVRVMPK